MTDAFDVAVIGAGPSGLAAAIRLRQMGRSVVVLHRVRQRPSRMEAMTPGVADILSYLRADDVLADAGATPVRRHRVAWETRGAVTREPRSGEQSLLVQRRQFDEELARAALEHGASFRPSTRTIGVETSGDRQLISYSDDGVERVVEAKHVLEATGRPHGAKRKPLGPTLVALSARYEGALGDECEMLVEALDDGWVWAARKPGGALHVTAFGDPALLHVRWPGEPQRALSAMLASSVHLGQLGDAQSFEGVCDAGSYVCDDWLQDGHWKIGDSALGLDPLSSSGVEKSMRFALQAALAVNTILRRAGDLEIAKEFLAGKLNDACARHLSWKSEHYASAWCWPKGSFWWTRGSSPSAVGGTLIERLSFNHGEISTTLLGVPRIAAGVVIKTVPCALDDHIETRGAVVHPSLEDPIVFVDGVELAPLLRAGLGASSYPELIERWSRALARDRAVRICAWALQKGILTSEGVKAQR